MPLQLQWSMNWSWLLRWTGTLLTKLLQLLTSPKKTTQNLIRLVVEVANTMALHFCKACRAYPPRRTSGQLSPNNNFVKGSEQVKKYAYPFWLLGWCTLIWPTSLPLPFHHHSPLIVFLNPVPPITFFNLNINKPELLPITSKSLLDKT